MEIEAKFAVPDAPTFRRLEAAEDLAGYNLSKPKINRVEDVYLDTGDRRVYAAGYSYRRRVEAGKILITLKALGGGADSIYQREELEVSLPDDRAPADWPPSPMRDRVLQMINGKSLIPLLKVRQTRAVRTVQRDERKIAELSLDQVHVVAAKPPPIYLELECELLPDGTESDLAAIAKCLKEEWRLPPEPRSKFVRALASVSHV